MRLAVELIETTSRKNRVTLTPTRTTVKVGASDHPHSLSLLAIAALLRECLGDTTVTWRGVIYFEPDRESISVTITSRSGERQRHTLAMTDIERETGAYV